MAPVLAEIMVASLVLYVLLGGADYGAGFWDLLSHGPLKQEQRNLIATAIRPIWEANHVWLILILVLFFSGFPLAFGTIMIALHVPILLMLAGIVLRGSSFVFRAYSTMHSDMRRAFAYVFSISSCIYVRSNIWIYANEYAPERVYHGGKAGGTKVISLEVNVMEGALDADAKKDFMAFLTEAVSKRAGIPPQQRAPVFVLIRDVPGYNWGMFGKPVTLDGLRNPPLDAKPV